MSHFERLGRCKPYPELVEPARHAAPYRIDDSRGQPGPDGMVDLVRRRIHVPLEARGRPVVRHEMGHVCWSPTQLPELDFARSVMLAVEDSRVNLALLRKGVPVLLGPGARSQVASLGFEDLRAGRDGVFVLRCLASIGTNAGAELAGVAREALPAVRRLTEELVERVQEGLLADTAGTLRAEARFEVALELAREVARRLASLGIEVPQETTGCCLGAVEAEGAGGGDVRGRRPGRRDREGSGKGAPWGRMSLVEAPLDVVLPAAASGRARTWRASEEGSVVRWIHRSVIDGRIFRRPARRRGGTVLVDTSGSMSLDAEGVDRILEGTRAALEIAIYSGRRDEGELRIVARGGRRAAAEHLEPYGSANVVDVPALEWLVRRPAPRVWISDGGVTGVGDVPSTAVKERAKALVRRGRVQRVESIEDALVALGGSH